jgi:hypothetical protein
MSTGARNDVARQIISAQDDGDSVVLPNACAGELIQLRDGEKVRCFSVIVREPHYVPQESWSMITIDALPDVEEVDGVLADKLMVDHVTRGVIGNNAIQFALGEKGCIQSMRLLPPSDGPAQAQWEVQAASMIQ